MRLDVPDSFLELIKDLDWNFEHIVDDLKWASENQETAVRVVGGWKLLGRTGKKVFYTNILSGSDPSGALEYAKKHEDQLRARMIKVAHVAREARRGGYKFTTPNGVECVVKVVDDKHSSKYWFDFNVQGEHVILVYNNWRISDVLQEAENGDVATFNLSSVVYQGKQYYKGERYDRNVSVFIEAIKKNMNPCVLMAVDPKTDENR